MEKDKKFLFLATGFAIGTALGGSVMRVANSYENADIRANAELGSNSLELTCEQLSERGFEVKGVDGTAYKIVCEDYKVPAEQERGQ